MPKKPSNIEIKSFQELVRREDEILQRIHEVNNGGMLFLASPFRLLADVGVQLSAAARKEIVKRHPELSAASDSSYDALRRNDSIQNVRVRMRALFRKEKP